MWKWICFILGFCRCSETFFLARSKVESNVFLFGLNMLLSCLFCSAFSLAIRLSESFRVLALLPFSGQFMDMVFVW